MFSFLRRQKLTKVRAILEGRINRSYARQLDDGDRHGARGALCEVAFLVPYTNGRTADFDSARPVWTRDMSWAGMSILDDTLLDTETVLVALKSDTEYKFLHCLVEHCSHLGYGHFQIGLQPTEVVGVDGSDLRRFDKRLAELEAAAEAEHAEPATAGA